MRNNPLVKAIMALLHLIDSVISSDFSANKVRDRAHAQRGVPNDPGGRPLKR
jgi:hypothetical protein